MSSAQKINPFNIIFLKQPKGCDQLFLMFDKRYAIEQSCEQSLRSGVQRMKKKDSTSEDYVTQINSIKALKNCVNQLLIFIDDGIGENASMNLKNLLHEGMTDKKS